MRAFKFLEDLLGGLWWPTDRADPALPEPEPRPPEPTDIIGSCTECHRHVLRCDGARDDDKLVHVECLAKLYGGRANRAKMQLVWETLARPFFLAFGESIKPSLETLLMKGVDPPTARAYLDSLERKLRSSGLDDIRRRRAENALKLARELL